MAEEVKTTVTTSKSLPPIEKLFSDSWALFRVSLSKVLTFNLLMLGISLVVGLLVLIVLGVALGGIIVALYHGNFSTAAIGTLGLGILVGVIVFIAACIVLGSMVQAGTILTMNEAGLGIEKILRKSTHYILPLFGVSLLMMLFALPAFFLFIIPAFFVVFFLYFAPYAVVVGNYGALQSFRRSAYLVKSNFGAMMLRALLMVAVFFIIGIVFSASSLTTGNLGALTIILAIVRIIVEVFAGWFLVAYSLTLFKQAEALEPDKTKGVRLIWFVLLSIISILFVVLVVGSIVKAISGNQEIKTAITGAIMQNATKSSSDRATNSPDLIKQTYKNAFVSSCENGKNTNSELCTCIADNLVDKYTAAQLQDIVKKYAATKEVPQSFTDAARACSSTTAQ